MLHLAEPVLILQNHFLYNIQPYFVQHCMIHYMLPEYIQVMIGLIFPVSVLYLNYLFLTNGVSFNQIYLERCFTSPCGSWKKPSAPILSLNSCESGAPPT